MPPSRRSRIAAPLSGWSLTMLALLAAGGLRAGEGADPVALAAGESIALPAADGSGVLLMSVSLPARWQTRTAATGQVQCVVGHLPSAPAWSLQLVVHGARSGADAKAPAVLPTGTGHVLGQEATWQEPRTDAPQLVRILDLPGWRARPPGQPACPRISVLASAADAALLAQVQAMVAGMQWKPSGAVPDKAETRALAANQAERIAIGEIDGLLTATLPMAATLTIKPATAPATRIIEWQPAAAGAWRISITVNTDTLPRESGTYDQVLGSEIMWQQSGLTATTVVPRLLGTLHGRDFIRPRLALAVTGANPVELKSLLGHVRAMRWTTLSTPPTAALAEPPAGD